MANTTHRGAGDDRRPLGQRCVPAPADAHLAVDDYGGDAGDVAARDRGCRFPGCGLPFGQGHHIRHWAHGGPTTLSNLAMLCRRHHRAVHEEGFQDERQPDGELYFRRPDGRPLPEVPATPAVPATPCEALRTRHDALDIHARTATPGWLGERLDVGYAISVLI